MTVITLSRQLGSHGEEIAARVAQTLDLRLVDAETINKAAQNAGVPQMALAELVHEGEHGLANQVLKALRTMPSLPSPYLVPHRGPGVEGGPEGIPEVAPPATPPAGEAETIRPSLSGLTIPFAGLFSPTVPPISASLEQYMRMVGLVVQGLAREDNVLIIGRGGQVLLRKHPGALHVQIVAPFVHRIQVVMARDGVDKRTAQHRVRASDRARFDFVRRYHDADWLDSTLYHLVINTGRVSVPTAVDLIIAAQQAVMRRPDLTDTDKQ